MQDYKKLSAWQKAHGLAIATYKATGTFPKDELYGLTSQIRRSCISIPANIAEGCGREGNVELGRFMQISLGSANELEYHLLLSRELHYLKIEDYERLNKQVNEVKGMLINFIQKLKT